MDESKAAAFRRELLSLLEKYEAQIVFDPDSADYYSIHGEKIIAVDRGGNELMRVRGYSVEAHDIKTG